MCATTAVAPVGRINVFAAPTATRGFSCFPARACLPCSASSVDRETTGGSGRMVQQDVDRWLKVMRSEGKMRHRGAGKRQKSSVGGCEMREC